MRREDPQVSKDLYDRLNKSAELRGVSIEQPIEELADRFGQALPGVAAVAEEHEQSDEVAENKIYS